MIHTGLLVEGAGYVGRPGLQKGADGYYTSAFWAEFEWNNEGFIDWDNHGVGGGNYSSIKGVTAKQVLDIDISPEEVLRYYEQHWMGTGRENINVRRSIGESGFNVSYTDPASSNFDIRIGSMFVSTVQMKENLAQSNGGVLNADGVSLQDMRKNPPNHPEYESPKGGDRKVRHPRGIGWIDKKGRIWIPNDNKGNHAPHWDRQKPNGQRGWDNVYPLAITGQQLIQGVLILGGAAIILFDIITIPSGEGLIGVEMIRRAVAP